MNTLNSVCAWNNKGVRMVAEGSFMSAAVSFREALDVSLLLAEHSADRVSRDSTLQENTLSSPQLWEIHSVPTNHAIELKSSYIVFDHCFQVLPLQENIRTLNHHEMELLVAIVLYNTALTYHLAGMGEASQRHVKMAQKIYQRAASVLSSLRLANDNDDNKVTAVLLATINNMASLALDVHDLSRFGQYRHLMGQLLSAAPLSNHDGIGYRSFFPSIFVNNFTISASAHERPAAAA